MPAVLAKPVWKLCGYLSYIPKPQIASFASSVSCAGADYCSDGYESEGHNKTGAGVTVSSAYVADMALQPSACGTWSMRCCIVVLEDTVWSMANVLCINLKMCNTCIGQLCVNSCLQLA